MTEAFDRPSGANSATGQAIAGGYLLQAAAGVSGAKRFTAGGSADVGNTHILALRRLNAPPTVSLTSPANGATFSAPASITLAATAADADGSVAKVEFFQGTSLVNTDTVSPYSFNWTNVPAGAYTLTAKATDNLGAATTSSPVNITVTAPAAVLYFIHPDQLNTPRVITNPSQQVVWRWDNTDAFGANMANENPGGLGVFTCNLRFPGQYFDRETNLHYNIYRDYSPEIGRYIESDPIGLDGGINTYSYVGGNPLSKTDPEGLIAATQPSSWTSTQSAVSSPTTSPPSQNQNICQVDRVAPCNAQFVQCFNRKPGNSTWANNCARSLMRCIDGFPTIFPGGGFVP